MAFSITDNAQDELCNRFETWFVEKIKNVDQNADIGIFIKYILTTLSADDISDEEKTEAILPFLQELNQNNIFDAEKLLDETMLNWKQIKSEFEKEDKLKNHSINQENPTDTILSMINQHKTHLVKTKKKQNNDAIPATDNYVYVGSDEDEKNNTESGLFENKNAEDALNREKVKREKQAEASKKQKEQAKKALAEQRQREEERKKKAQQKAAKVERKR